MRKQALARAFVAGQAGVDGQGGLRWGMAIKHTVNAQAIRSAAERSLLSIVASTSSLKYPVHRAAAGG